jgi:hypothetical protein
MHIQKKLDLFFAVVAVLALVGIAVGYIFTPTQ